MLLRLVLALGGITFVVTGLRILLSDSCNSVTWGSRGAPEGAISPQSAMRRLLTVQ